MSRRRLPLAELTTSGPAVQAVLSREAALLHGNPARRGDPLHPDEALWGYVILLTRDHPDDEFERRFLTALEVLGIRHLDLAYGLPVAEIAVARRKAVALLERGRGDGPW
jgi:hypothetical protein